ncbi:hypothetical protein BCR36DRAFT_372441 [Piromyces finnis]|uniref:ABC transporter domain-containing protein n=1 Tax=Piromyces finnis TaxID=1754191 RepID=A0A1Y1V2V1_9FUNG|nr:hypothetical protein BCR36DRAFT_372441 [Piromyces finnis]|eukprot:ORX45952.1 hypothetical protein BCR36DRAFT_372441 [Piromyces finnis]
MLKILILISLLIIYFNFFFGYYSKTDYKDTYFEKIENFKLENLETYSDGSLLYKVEFGFIFPPEFDNQKRQIFLNNFKSNKFFDKFNYLENNQNFTLDNEKVNNVHEYKIKILENEEESEKELKKSEKEYFIYYSVIFTSLIKYTIGVYYMEELYEKIKNVEFNYIMDNEYFDEFEYVSKYQTIINKSIIKMLSPNSQDFSISYTLLDRNSYTEKTKENTIQSFVPLFMLFYFIPCICNLLVLLVIEKETKIKESLVIIGLKKSSFWVSWAITYGIIILFTSIIVTAVMIFSELFVYIHWSVLIISIVIFGLSCCSISFILSTLINKSRTANTIGAMVIALFFAMFFIDMFMKKYLTLYNVLQYIISPISFLSLFDYLIKYDEQRINVNLFNIFNKLGLKNSFLGLIFTFVFYLIIAIYLDNVIPQGNNFYKKWNFFITDIFKNKKHKLLDPCHKNTNNQYIQEDPKDLKKAVEIRNICKTFKIKGERVEILKNIDFNAFYNEIFAILGHNGAGKTTLMSIMTGILSSTKGEVYYDGIPITGNETEIYIDLSNKKNNYPKELSGGQRRKLCITLALLGSPKYVFLDEPTTGLDPYSRKNIWELLSRKKEDCVIFVTTHYMDEADLLADRKMIISNGNISCLGTSLFLKQKFNMNYSLDIHCENTKDFSISDKIMDEFCPGTTNTRTISNTNMQSIDDNISKSGKENGDYIISYSLPMKYVKNFKHIFENINKIIKDHHNSIKKFSLTAPTLEELFIKLEHNDENSLQYQKAKKYKKLDPIFSKKLVNKSTSFRQIMAIVKLRLKIFLRNKSFAFIYTLLPVALSIICIYLVNSLYLRLQSNEPTIFQSLNISNSLYENEKWFKEANITSPALNYINKIESANKISIDTVSYANDISISNGKDISKLNYIGGFYGYSENQNLHFIIYKNITDTFATSIGIDILSNAILEQNNNKDRFSISIHPLNLYYDNYNENDKDNLFNIAPEMSKREMEPILITGLSLCISLCISIFGPYAVKEREEGITHQLFLNGTKRINYWLGILISDSICIFVPILIITFAGYINNISIFHPNIIIFTLVMSVMWIVGSLLNQYVISYFFNRYEKISTIFVIINPILSLFVGTIMITLAARSHLVFMDDIDQVTDGRELKKIRKDKMMLYGICKDRFIILVLFAIASIIIYGILLVIIEKIKKKQLHKHIEYSQDEISKKEEFMKNEPIDVRNEFKRVRQSLNDRNANISLNVFQLNKDFIIKHKDIKKKRKDESINKIDSGDGIEDKAIKNKKNLKMKNKRAFEKMDNRITYDEKKKKYINRIVDDVTFGVNIKECLGLLGPNGAGKTTSISMITGLLAHTHGVIKYGEKDFNKTDIADLSLGYCSQHDSLWKLLTVKETVNFYLNICGYSRKDIPRYTKALIESCGIENHANKKVCEISGGTKRKLSLIIAICSSPDYLILDEPSAGMDPFTRRYMWNLISKLKNGRETVTILTTHSTEEAEALCDRIAILIKGRLVCIDTPRSIRMNYNNTYTLEVFTSDPERFEESFVKEKNLFGLDENENYEVESSINYQKYSVKIKIENIARVFSLMEDAKEQKCVNQYNFVMTMSNN